MSLGLRVLAWLFGLAVDLRNALYDRGWLRVRRATRPVVSVGALAVGGSGKTPLVMRICELAASLGHRPAILTRGYRGTLEHEGGEVRPGDDARRAGDEPLLLARRLAPLGVRVYAGKRRHRMAARAIAEGATLLVLDDGFQHRGLHRDLDLVLVDGGIDPNALRLLPAGPLREPPASLRRAHLVVVRGEGAAPDGAAPIARVQDEALDVVRVPGGETLSVEALRDHDFTIALGLARPERFVATAVALGARVVELRAFRDHHPFSASELATPKAALLTSEKDAMRWPEGVSAWVLRHRLRVTEGEDALREALRRLGPP